jgi:hypothetical protein
MKYAVTDEIAKRVAMVMLENHPDGIDEWQASTDEMRQTFYRSVRSGLEYFAQTLGEPVAVPSWWRDSAALLLRKKYGMETINSLMAADDIKGILPSHHPTTEKGCE